MELTLDARMQLWPYFFQNTPRLSLNLIILSVENNIYFLAWCLYWGDCSIGYFAEWWPDRERFWTVATTESSIIDTSSASSIVQRLPIPVIDSSSPRVRFRGV